MTQNEFVLLNKVRLAYMEYLAGCKDDAEYESADPIVKEFQEVIQRPLNEFINNIMNHANTDESRAEYRRLIEADYVYPPVTAKVDTLFDVASFKLLPGIFKPFREDEQ